MKLRIYIDEVGNNDIGSSNIPNHRYLCLTGVVFDLGYVKSTLSPELDQLKSKYFNSHPDDPIILHRKELMNKKHPFKALCDPEIEKQFNAELLSHLERWQFKTITVLIDKIERFLSQDFWQGTEWIKHEDIDETITSKELKIKAKSANVSGLQIADLLAYPLYRYALKFFKLKDDGRDTFNEQIIEVIKPKIYKGGSKIMGYGLKLLP